MTTPDFPIPVEDSNKDDLLENPCTWTQFSEYESIDWGIQSMLPVDAVVNDTCDCSMNVFDELDTLTQNAPTTTVPEAEEEESGKSNGRMGIWEDVEEDEEDAIEFTWENAGIWNIDDTAPIPTTVVCGKEEARILSDWGTIPYTTPQSQFQSSRNYPTVVQYLKPYIPFYTELHTLFQVTGPVPFTITIGGHTFKSAPHSTHHAHNVVEFPSGLPVFQLASAQCLAECVGANNVMIELIGEVYSTSWCFPLEMDTKIVCPNQATGYVTICDGILHEATLPENPQMDPEELTFLETMPVKDFIKLSQDEQQKITTLLTTPIPTDDILRREMDMIHECVRTMEAWSEDATQPTNTRLEKLRLFEMVLACCVDTMRDAVQAAK